MLATRAIAANRTAGEPARRVERDDAGANDGGVNSSSGGFLAALGAASETGAAAASNGQTAPALATRGGAAARSGTDPRPSARQAAPSLAEQRDGGDAEQRKTGPAAGGDASDPAGPADETGKPTLARHHAAADGQANAGDAHTLPPLSPQAAPSAAIFVAMPMIQGTHPAAPPAAGGGAGSAGAAIDAAVGAAVPVGARAQITANLGGGEGVRPGASGDSTAVTAAPDGASGAADVLAAAAAVAGDGANAPADAAFSDDAGHPPPAASQAPSSGQTWADGAATDNVVRPMPAAAEIAGSPDRSADRPGDGDARGLSAGPAAATTAVAATVGGTAAPVAAAPLATPLAAAAAPDSATAGLADQVASRLVGTLAAGRLEVVLRLHPPELGELNVRLQVSGREVAAWFDSPVPQVQLAVSQGMAQLQASLATAGYNLNGAWIGGDAWSPPGWNGADGSAPRPQSRAPDSNQARPRSGARSPGAGFGVSLYV
jgi:flagellar hook-length control protein FliK